MSWKVYLMRCSDNSLYCGISKNVQKREDAHNSGKGAKYTRGRCPVKIVWISGDTYEDKGDALREEIRIKKLSKSLKEKLCNQYLKDEN